MTNSYDHLKGSEENIDQNVQNISDQVDTSSINVYRPQIPSNTEAGERMRMQRAGDIISAMDSQRRATYKNLLNRAGIKNNY